VQTQALRDWLDANFAALAARVAPAGSNFVYAYAEGLCSADEADAVQAKFAERLRTMEGGPRTLAQVTEGVRLCAALKARVAGAPLAVPAP
jgi:alanyl aminopeptidase